MWRKEKSEQQRADVAAVDVGVGHQNNLVIAELAGVEIVFADAGAERGDDGANFFVAEHLVVARFFDVENLPLSGKIACDLRSRPIFAEPPADSPRRRRARNATDRAPGSQRACRSPLESIADLRRVSSRALRAASRARAASMHFAMMRRATVECLSNHSPSRSLTSARRRP